MASAAIKTPREVVAELPTGTSGNNQLSVSISTRATLTMTVPDGDTVRVDIIGTMPDRATHLYLQARQCGDWYCEIKADRYVSAIGATRREACENVLRKSGGSAA
jgi:hypothetical protein